MPTITAGPRGYSPIYGGVPQLPGTGQVSSNVSNILNTAIPGYSGLTRTASSSIADAMAGKLPQDVQDVIQNNAAEQAVLGGMPGSSRINGTLFGNKSLRDLGVTSLQQKQQGLNDFLSLLRGVSGTVAPTYGQAQEQLDQQSGFQAAPIPSQAQTEQERLFNKYSNPAAGIGGLQYSGGISGIGGLVDTKPVTQPWFNRG